MDQEEVRRRVRDRLRDGSLPRVRYTRMWGGNGAGLPCAACGDLIPTGGLEIEVQFMTPNGFTARRFHTLCFAVWELERGQD